MRRRVLVPLLIAAGVLAAASVSGALRGTGVARNSAGSGSTLGDLLSSVEPGRVGSLDAEEARVLGKGIIEASIIEDTSPHASLRAVFPDPAHLIAMLARDRDRDDFEESAGFPGAAGDRYEHIAALVPEMRILRPMYEALFAGARDSLAGYGMLASPSQTHADAAKYRSGVSLPGESTPPRKRDYLRSHTYALDIFFSEGEELPFGGGEKGPLVFSPTGGIVVAAASDWKGGGGIETYRSGGITPNAGNGVVVYDPDSRRFYLYFHLHSLLVGTGEAIRSGQPLGYIGDSGANARKPGHGGHLHLEIYDSAHTRFLKHSEISEMIF